MKQRIIGLGWIGTNPCFSFKWARAGYILGQKAVGYEGFRRWKIARKAWKTRRARQQELGI